MPLSDVKAVGQALGCTVNDVLIASAAGALNTYLHDCGEATEGLQIHATVPVNFGLVFIEMPVGEDNPLKRLMLVHENMEALKKSRQAAVSFGLLAALGMGPSQLQKPMLDMMSRKASMVLTNVPGPRESLYMAGSPIREMMFWVPQNGSIGMGISILSYNNQVYMGMMTDRRLVPDPQVITDSFEREFEKLLYLTLQMPEGEVSPTDIDAWLEKTLSEAEGATLKTNIKKSSQRFKQTQKQLKVTKKVIKKVIKKKAVKKKATTKKVVANLNAKSTIGGYQPRWKKTGKKSSKKLLKQINN